MTRQRKREVRVPQEGDIMRVKETGTLVRLVASKDSGDDSLVDAGGYVYVEPIDEIADWYNISELEAVERLAPRTPHPGERRKGANEAHSTGIRA